MSTLGNALRAARRAQNLSQHELAKRAGVTQPHLSLLERGLDAHVSVVDRVAHKLGLSLSLQRVLPYDDDAANRIFALAQAAARRVTPEKLAVLRDWFELQRRRDGDYPHYREWLAILDQGPARVASILADRTEYGRYMRSVATMRPFVTKEERDAVWRPDFNSEAVA
jgi:transcriptional regulator with XRE-family HTH domain